MAKRLITFILYFSSHLTTLVMSHEPGPAQIAQHKSKHSETSSVTRALSVPLEKLLIWLLFPRNLNVFHRFKNPQVWPKRHCQGFSCQKLSKSFS